MPTYYRGSEILITDESFATGGDAGFRVYELDDIHMVVVRQNLLRRIHELRATYRGQPVLLHRTADAQTSGQVRRALIRAIEASGVDTVIWWQPSDAPAPPHPRTTQPMTEPRRPSVWDDPPAYNKVQKWQRAVPDAAEHHRGRHDAHHRPTVRLGKAPPPQPHDPSGHGAGTTNPDRWRW